MAQAFGDTTALLNGAEFEAVTIVTPDAWQAPVAIECRERRDHRPRPVSLDLQLPHLQRQEPRQNRLAGGRWQSCPLQLPALWPLKVESGYSLGVNVPSPRIVASVTERKLHLPAQSRRMSLSK